MPPFPVRVRLGALVCGVCGALGAGVPVSVLAASPQRYVRARKRRHTHVPRRSTIIRLRSGAPVSRAGAFRIGPFRKGAMRRALARLRSRVRFGRRSAHAQPPFPRCAMHPPLRCAWLGRDTSLRQSPPSRRRLSHPGGGLRSGPAPPLRPLDTLIVFSFHSGASVPLAPAREPCPRSAHKPHRCPRNVGDETGTVGKYPLWRSPRKRAL